MSLKDSVTDLVTDTVTVQRRATGTWIDGVYVPNPVTTNFPADVVWQPAFGLNRVVGGADLHGRVDNQSSTEVYDFFTLTEVRGVSPENDADVIVDFRGANWTVARVEKWPDPEDLDGGLIYRAIVTRQTGGGP